MHLTASVTLALAGLAIAAPLDTKRTNTGNLQLSDSEKYGNEHKKRINIGDAQLSDSQWANENPVNPEKRTNIGSLQLSDSEEWGNEK